MRVILIGSGNVATVLGRKILHSGHLIDQVFSRNISHATELASELSTAPVSEISEIKPDADLYLVAVSDDSLQHIDEWLKLGDRLVTHTAGSVPMEVLKGVSQNYGVLYPLQSLRKEITDQQNIPLLVDANNAWNKTRLAAFVQSLGETAGFADDEQRRKLHLAAVMTNNFSNYLYTLTEDFCSREGVDFQMILPLLQETVRRLSFASPSAMQTGPAARNDEGTIKKQKEMLREYPKLLELYDVFTESIRKGGNGQ
jgi:predicted short-subunit dehydrogenase-like oxidoreductase (DUF2520 family)